MRLAIGLTGLATATSMATLIFRPSVQPLAPVTSDQTALEVPQPLVIRHLTQYVQLRAGETAPPGATVVQKPAASPRVIVVTVPAPPARRVVVVATTRQSGVK